MPCLNQHRNTPTVTIIRLLASHHGCIVCRGARLSSISGLSSKAGSSAQSSIPFPRHLRIRHLPLTPNKHLRVSPTLMSHPYPTGPSSPNFRLIFNNALKVYEKQTKNDILFHPLAADLQACQSPSAILAVLQQQVQDLNQSRTSDERLTKWLEPTINVLHAFSETIGEGVSLVRLMT